MITQAQYQEAKAWLKTNRKTVKKMAGQWIAIAKKGFTRMVKTKRKS